jgi:hypothetical protein
LLIWGPSIYVALHQFEVRLAYQVCANCGQILVAAKLPDFNVNILNLLKNPREFVLPGCFALAPSTCRGIVRVASERNFIIQVAREALSFPGPATGPVHGAGLAKIIATRPSTITGATAPATQHGQFSPEILQDHFG